MGGGVAVGVEVELALDELVVLVFEWVLVVEWEVEVGVG